MSKDLFFGATKKNWARGSSAPLVSRPNLELTAAEKVRLEKLAVVKMKADSGDKAEKKHWQKLRGDLAKLRARARKGDKKAARLAAVVEESGLFGDFQQTFAMSSGEGQKLPNPYGDQSAKPLPRKPNPFARARMDGATEILGAFVGDEARARREECGALPFFNRAARAERRRRKLARLQSRAAAGDVRAQERLRRIQSRLSQSQYNNPALAASAQSSNPAFMFPTAATSYQPPYQPAYQPTASNPYAGLPPLPPDEEYVQDVYV